MVGGVVTVRKLPAPEGKEAGCPAREGSAAAGTLARKDLAQLPVMDCGCGATIVVLWVGA